MSYLVYVVDCVSSSEAARHLNPGIVLQCSFSLIHMISISSSSAN